MDVIQNHRKGKNKANASGEPLPETEGNPRTKGLRERLLPLFIHKRGRILIAIVLTMILFEVLENLIDLRYGSLVHQVYDIVFFIITIPAGAWLLLTLLEGAVAAGEQANYNRNLQADFSQKLGNAHGWEELLREIMAFTHQVLPGARTTLYVLQPQKQCLQAEALGTPDGEIFLKPELEKQNVLLTPAAGASDDFILPINRSDQQVGMMRVEFPSRSSLSIPEIRALEASLPMVALALDAALLQDLAATQAAASDAERQKIAQDLHDSLAQNISYLRLKLDQLTGENAIREIGVVLQELERMRASADEAYQQVRNTIDELAVINGEDLAASIENQAHTISSRSGFVLRTSRIGTACVLPAATRQHILNIAREALHNVEKHAGAHLVHLQLLWLETELIIKITDDGAGFDPLSVPSEGHYGLWIMKQRAQDIGGTLRISPAEEHGTEITLWVPYPERRVRAAAGDAPGTGEGSSDNG